MRPYRRKHRRLKTRSGRGLASDVFHYLGPFICNLRVLWKLGPPFPLSGKFVREAEKSGYSIQFLTIGCKPEIFLYLILLLQDDITPVGSRSPMYHVQPKMSFQVTITVLTSLLLFIPLFYFLVPPLVTVLLINYFSETWTCDEVFTKIGEIFADAVNGCNFQRKTLYLWKLSDRFSVAFFIYDYYQILKYLRDF